MYKRGAIVLVPFPFTNLSSVKLRPALVVSAFQLNQQDVIVLFISSVKDRRLSAVDLAITKNSRNFIQTGLKRDSVFKCNKIATLAKSVILGEIGLLAPDLMDKIDQRLRIVLNLK